jgi:2-C-methyl-D-erythritol 4-phosphate cytidylyltransferase/2-C-methyl-D-erythritol 2,4-cyclodiphosphate synthase
MKVATVIVAGGSGIRAGGELPKQYQKIGGRPVIWWTMKAFSEHPGVSWVQPVIGNGHEELFARSTEGIAALKAVTGGSTRQDSCRAGVEALEGLKPDIVLIHDAARPFVSQELISHVIAELSLREGVIPALPINETIKRAPGGNIEATVDRNSLWAAQTPQGFRFDAILKAHRDAHTSKATNLTDDASIAERAGMTVSIIAGRSENKKITTAEDLVDANRNLMRASLDRLADIRLGHGIDIHQFEPGEYVTLCGVKIPHQARLQGHSDADAALHALTDAILGALGESDIGKHFPPSDPKWKGADSRVFVRKAMEFLKSRGGQIGNADITILTEAPRIGPHIAAMKQVLSKLLEIGEDRIAIKATTTEKLGYIGRGEGLEAHASVLVRLPL